MYNHPELGLRLAQAKAEEAQSRAQRASALRAAVLDRRVSGVTAGTRRYKWAALMLAMFSRSRAWRRSVRQTPPGQRRAELPLANPRHQLPVGRPLAPRSALLDQPTR